MAKSKSKKNTKNKTSGSYQNKNYKKYILIGTATVFIIAAVWIFFISPASNLKITDGQKTKAEFNVTFSTTPAERSKGLMYVEKMPKDEGMLFVFDEIDQRYMWMRNTYIPLDMLFINKDKEIVHIYENAKPLNDRIIPSIYKIKYVLEINGGIVSEKGIKKGDQLEFDIPNEKQTKSENENENKK
jgi:hypothetical protein